MEHQKDTNNQNRFNRTPETSKVFQGYGFIMRKAEKLTTALYLVTDIFSDREPMKWKMREVAVELLSDITVAASATSSEKISMLRVVLKKIEKLVSFIDVASSTHLMSEMNASVLRREYAALKDGVEAEWSRVQERGKTMLNERFFEVARDALSLAPDAGDVSGRSDQVEMNVGRPVHKEVPRITQAPTTSETVPYTNSDLTTAHEREAATAPSHSAEPVTQQVVAPKITEASPALPMRTFTPSRVVISDRDVVARSRPDVTRDDRRKIILALIKQKPAITVGDIAKSIPGISEKTIQRELLAMVEEHVLIKRGERRWSTYSLRNE